MIDTIASDVDTILSLPDNGLPLHERLAGAVEAAIVDGRYRPGARLPTHRQLAQQFSVSIGSVTRAIDTLSARGVVRGEIGRGTFVLGVSGGDDDGGVIDLTINAPPPVISLQRLAEATAIANVQAMRLVHGGYEDHSGTQRQRGVVAGWLTETRTKLRADEILLCNGAQQGLHLAFASLREGFGSTILTEHASFPGALAAAASLGMAMSPVANDGEGLLPDALDGALKRTGARIIYTTPVCQNPLGFETGPERRRAIAAVVKRHGAMIVEDDIYGLYAAKGSLTYRELLPDQTIYVTSFSKSLTPLVRLGVIAPPPELTLTVRRRLRAESWGLPPYVAELSVAMIAIGVAEEAAIALRAEGKARLDLTRSILGLGDVPMPGGAPHVWLPMTPLAAEQFSRRASEAGVRITPPSAAQVGQAPVAGVRLCIMAPPQRGVLERGLRIIAGIIGTDEDVVV